MGIFGEVMKSILEHYKDLTGIEPKRTGQKHNGEYSGPCPKAGCCEEDGFQLWPDENNGRCIGGYWCRGCDAGGDTISFLIDIAGEDIKRVMKGFGVKNVRAPMIRQYRSRIIPPPSDSWREMMEPFVQVCNNTLLDRPELLEKLERRGISRAAVVRYKIGYWPNHHNAHLNLDVDGDVRICHIPAGIVIPSWDHKGRLTRAKIRRDDYASSGKKFYEFPGSMNALTLVGSYASPLAVVFESELDAYALSVGFQDRILCAAVGSNNRKPDYIADAWLKEKKFVFVSHDMDDAGFEMWKKWMEWYPDSAVKWPVPESAKDFGEAVERGIDLEYWLRIIFERLRDLDVDAYNALMS